jgi:hypothetical protein
MDGIGMRLKIGENTLTIRKYYDGLHSILLSNDTVGEIECFPTTENQIEILKFLNMSMEELILLKFGEK